MREIKYILLIITFFQHIVQCYAQPVLCETQYKDLLNKCYQRADLYTRLVGLFTSSSDPEEMAKYKQTIYALFENKEAKTIVDDIATYGYRSDSGRSIEEYLYLIPDHLPPDETTIIFTLENPSIIYYNQNKDEYFTTINVAKKIHKKSSTIYSKRIIIVGIEDIDSYTPSFNIIKILNNNYDYHFTDIQVTKKYCEDQVEKTIIDEDDFIVSSKFNNENILTRGKINRIQWQGGPSEVNLYYSKNGNIEKSIVKRIPNKGYYRWKIPSNAKPGDYKLSLINNKSELVIRQEIRIRRKFPLVLKIAIPGIIAMGLILTQMNNENSNDTIGVIPYLPDN